MIPKLDRVVITFHTTTEAMRMEQCCKAAGAPGRMIPVPRAISAGCGLAWSAPPESEELLRDVMSQNAITPQAVQRCWV